MLAEYTDTYIRDSIVRIASIDRYQYGVLSKERREEEVENDSSYYLRII